MIILVYNKGCDIVRKLNNKGFAISTVLYGLLIVLILITTLIMSTMSFTRKNGKEFTYIITNNLEKSKRRTYNTNEICAQQSSAYRDKYTCDEINDKLKQDFFAICYRSDKNADNCRNLLQSKLSEISSIYNECVNDNSNSKATPEVIKKSCCYSKAQGNSLEYSSCIQ